MTSLPHLLNLELESWAGSWHRTKHSLWSRFFFFKNIYFFPLILCFSCYRGVERQKEEKNNNSRLSRKQGVKLAEELPNKCVCVHTGELGFVYYLFWISICPQIKLQEKGEPGMRSQMSAALKSCERNPSERLKQQMHDTQTKACATLSVAFCSGILASWEFYSLCNYWERW